MGVLEILFLIFVVLKLAHVIDWSWFWVCAPLIPAFIIWILIIGFSSTALFLAAAYGK